MKARISSASSPICQFRKRKSNDFDAKGAVERPKNQYGTASGTYDTERYYTFDANQNITAVFDGANGNVLERYVYDPYGAVTVYDSAWANPTAPSQPKTARCMSVTTSTPRPASTTCAIATTTRRSVGLSHAITISGYSGEYSTGLLSLWLLIDG